MIHGALAKVPIRIRNSPTKLPVPGRPREAAAKNRLMAGRYAIFDHRPPISRMSRVWVRS
ncbi:hypothetical protein D3C78_1407960 [compost metagenome]